MKLIWERFLPYRAKQKVILPDYHYVDHRIEILSHEEDYSKVALHAIAEARYSLMPIPKTKWNILRKIKATLTTEFLKDVSRKFFFSIYGELVACGRFFTRDNIW